VLAALAALGWGGGTTDSHGVLAWIVQAPFGRSILVALAVGLAGFALWRLTQAIRDTEFKGTDAKGLLNRAVYAASGLIYMGLAYSALRLAQGQGEVSGNTGDTMAQDWTAWLLSQPFGQVLVGVAGLVVLGMCGVQFYLAFTEKCCDPLHLAEMGDLQERLVKLIARAGYSARGAAFAVIGLLLVVAAIYARPELAHGVGGALETLAQQPFGPWLLGAVAVGFVAYGIFMMVQARYRRFAVK
jgi:Domain of Unknown Function (DUF1206)